MLIQRRLTLLTRPGCDLCDEAQQRLERLLRWLPIDLVTSDISDDKALEAEYHLRIPVVLDRNGRVLAEGQIGGLRALGAALRGLS